MKMEIEIKIDFWSTRLNYSSISYRTTRTCFTYLIKKKKKKEILSSLSIFPRGINKQWRCSTRHVRRIAASKNKNGVVTREGADAGEIYHCTRDIYARSARTRTVWKHEEGNKESRGAKNDDRDPRHKSRTRVEQVDRTMHGVAYQLALSLSLSLDFHLISALYNGWLNDLLQPLIRLRMPDTGRHKRYFKQILRMEMSNAAFVCCCRYVSTRSSRTTGGQEERNHEEFSS